MWSSLRRPNRAASATKERPRRFVPVLEQLEPRLALAGNVMAVVSGGNLIVTGDIQGVYLIGADITVSQPFPVRSPSPETAPP